MSPPDAGMSPRRWVAEDGLPDASPAIVGRAAAWSGSVAIRDAAGDHRYADLLDGSAALAGRLLDGRADLDEARVAFLCSPSADWVVALWAIWRAGGVAVPLAASHPEAELAWAVGHTGAEALIIDAGLRERGQGIVAGRDVAVIDPGERGGAGRLPAIGSQRRAIIFFTSGTTGRPKGAVWAHRNVEGQASTLEQAWGWRPDDEVLAVLPLHHVHGVINVVTTALWAGAACRFATFEPERVWDHLAGGEITVFMAVPTIYVRLITAWDAADVRRRRHWSEGAAGLRLMVSGSAALPASVLERWESITGHRLLERYGMTELGMALSNPLDGPRIAGSVGRPLPGVEVRLVDDAGRDVGDGEPGEIFVRGPGVFLEYWADRAGTTAAFDDGWFRTGDVAVVDAGRYRILGRNSTDIIKTGGYKVSALEIEEVLREHPSIEDVAVVGLPDEVWGERVAAATVWRRGREVGLDELRTWLGDRLAPYKLPSRLVSVDQLPRNAMGKVEKGPLAGRFTEHG